jgi:hypothetical protein
MRPPPSTATNTSSLSNLMIMAEKRKATARDRPAKRTRAPSAEPLEDLTHGQSVRERAQKHRIAAAKFLVDDLTPTWTHGVNRELDKRHVSALCEIFEGQKLQRESEQNWLVVLCSRKDIERMLAYVQQAGVPTTETSSPWPWFGDWAKVIGGQAELMAGQHRVAALKAFFQKNGRLHASSDLEPLWWVCDIYDRGWCPISLRYGPD